jgi:hypothetical protein
MKTHNHQLISDLLHEKQTAPKAQIAIDVIWLLLPDFTLLHSIVVILTVPYFLPIKSRIQILT